jgi:omega-6 fatty acid desaturase (delta-12 desaturase)
MREQDQQTQVVNRPQAVDERTREEEVALRQVRQAVPRDLLKPNIVRSWWTLFRVLGCVAVCLYSLFLLRPSYGIGLVWQIPLLMGLWVLYGWVLVGLFVVGHDCGHRSFSKRKWINDLVGYFCMSPLANSFHTWRLTHNHHHIYTQLRGQDVDWAANLVTREEFESCTWRRSAITRLGYALPFGVFLWIAWNTVRRGFVITSMLDPAESVLERRRLILSNTVMAACMVAIHGGLFHFFGFWGMIKYNGFPATVAMVTGWLIIAIQHANEHSLLYDKTGWTPLRGQLVSTFDVRFPAVLEYLWCNINFHIPHHVSPAVPWYHLKEAGRAICQAYPEYYQEQKFELHQLTWFKRTPFLRPIEGKGYYVLDRPPREGEARTKS